MSIFAGFYIDSGTGTMFTDHAVTIAIKFYRPWIETAVSESFPIVDLYLLQRRLESLRHLAFYQFGNVNIFS